MGVRHSRVWVGQDSGVERKARHPCLICIELYGERGIAGREIFCCFVEKTYEKALPAIKQQRRVNLGKEDINTEQTVRKSYCEIFMWRQFPPQNTQCYFVLFSMSNGVVCGGHSKPHSHTLTHTQ